MENIKCKTGTASVIFAFHFALDISHFTFSRFVLIGFAHRPLVALHEKEEIAEADLPVFVQVEIYTFPFYPSGGSNGRLK